MFKRISDFGVLRAQVAATILAGHVMRAQQASKSERVADALLEADVLLNVIMEEEAEAADKAKAEADAIGAAKGGAGGKIDPLKTA